MKINLDNFNKLNSSNIPNPYDPSLNPHLANTKNVENKPVMEEKKTSANPYEIKHDIFNREVKEEYNSDLNQGNNYNIQYNNRNEKNIMQKNKMIFKYLSYVFAIIIVVVIIYIVYNIISKV